MNPADPRVSFAQVGTGMVSARGERIDDKLG
jgi:hypothetical protein